MQLQFKSLIKYDKRISIFQKTFLMRRSKLMNAFPRGKSFMKNGKSMFYYSGKYENAIWSFLNHKTKNYNFEFHLQVELHFQFDQQLKVSLK